MDKEAWHAVIHGIAKSQTRLSDWTELNHLAGGSPLPQKWGISSKSLQFHTAITPAPTIFLGFSALGPMVSPHGFSSAVQLLLQYLNCLDPWNMTNRLLCVFWGQVIKSTWLLLSSLKGHLPWEPNHHSVRKATWRVHMNRPKWWVNQVLLTVSQHLSSDLWISEPGVFPLRPQLTWNSDNSTHYGISVFLALFRMMIDNCFILM